ncbi:hypothetical protein [Paenibacillus oryzisoli]|uniref:Uncharacterized protein n=1 Tax=Paenibacillus oryzisoli TaxID=1850517 RepID=A0A198A8N6_9BACL|nr:hypothetical protein [Paenibacillus oryzisoli]OAS17465.1 hypothetical protein A8708_22125 [Paenibacillus oryzisoli]
MNISQELKDQLKENRLDQYRARIFNLQMDLALYESANDKEMIDKTQKALETGMQAYAVVEAM